MAIAFYAEDTKLPAIKKRAVGNWVKEVAATYGKKVGDISYIFCSDEKILEVNRQYLQHDYYTEAWCLPRRMLLPYCYSFYVLSYRMIC